MRTRTHNRACDAHVHTERSHTHNDTKFSWRKFSWSELKSRNSRKYCATKIWSYTVGSSEYCIWLCAIHPAQIAGHYINPLGVWTCHQPTDALIPSMISTLIPTIDYYYDLVYPLPVLHLVTTIVSSSAHPGVFFNMQCWITWDVPGTSSRLR